ncbi:hypothetical protein TYRP_007965 [Tyrophagus putrescentiae]|nr:hypothetical protein TYRP_007965 [Tyrophagus putrescentiae]
MDDEGWFHTNDIGMWLSNGCLKFIDRKEDLSFISNPYGKLIAPNKIENIYIQSIYVGQCYVDVDYDRGYLIGIIVPDIDGINLWCSENNMLLSAAEACKNVAFKNTLVNDITNIGKREGLEEHEQVSEVYLESDSFTQEAGLLTPTMKVKRHEMYVYFKHEIDQICLERMANSSKKIN